MYTLLFNFYPIENISILDIYLLLYCVQNIKSLKKVNISYNHHVILLMVVFLLVGIWSYDNTYFGLSQFLLNALRMLYYCFVYLIITQTVSEGKFGLIYKLIYSLKILVLLVFVEQLLQIFGIYWSYYFPGFTTNTGPQLGPFRPSGTFDEPSYLAIYLVLVYYIILKAEIGFKYWRVLIFTLLIVSRSFAGLAAIPILLSLEYTNNKSKRIQVQKLVFIGGIVLLMSGLVFRERIQGILAMEDGSSIHRLAGSWEVFLAIWNENPWTGIGFGQWLNWFNSQKVSFDSFFFMKGFSRGSGINNALLINFGSAGIFGVLSTLYFGWRITNKINYQILILWMYCSWGYFFHPFVFMFYGVVSGLSYKRKFKERII